jgi:hypothetical protein
MKNKSALLVGGVVVVVCVVVSFIIFNKPQEIPQVEEKKETLIKEVDMAAQPEWVQNLQVTTKRGISANGLKNVTFVVKGMPEGVVENLNYIVQYQTSNKGSQGAMSTKPIEIGGKTEYAKTVDFGTCSTKTCVHFDGVTEIELELDFVTASDKFSFVKTISL